MKFVDLDRQFVPLEKGQQHDAIEIGRAWGARYGGWLSWPDLLQYRRIVLLAEASSGKSIEFRHQADLLIANGKHAFFVSIEELADNGFERSLDLNDTRSFETWGKGGSDGWFFLDSVDEARLNHKSLEIALKQFARALDQSLDRAHVYISCRVTDWHGERDKATIERYLPVHELPKPGDQTADPLLDPIFEKKERTVADTSKEGEPKAILALKVVQLAPLSEDQYQKLAVARGVSNVDDFVDNIGRRGLDAYTERPGDLLDLADYWKEFGQFASLEKMTEHAISHKLQEVDPHRPDNRELNASKAHEGAERLAAALTLGKSFTIAVPQQAAEDALAPGAIDPTKVLPDWSDAERGALLRKGVFAPSTYGRIRFHHRATQEYLTAAWLHRLLVEGHAKSAVWNLVFAERYGVETIVPSLRPAVAWLAIKHPDFRREVLAREPLALIRFGDPGSLTLLDKETLLRTYAAKEAAAEIPDDHLDHRALWMFADPRLSKAIHSAWQSNQSNDLRLMLLRIIREGTIVKCVDLARAAALAPNSENYNRIVAVQILRECKDACGLKRLAALITKRKVPLNSRVAASCAMATFPKHLTVKQLLALIERVPDTRESVNGFSYNLLHFYTACSTANMRRELIGGLAELCSRQPFASDYHRVSHKHLALASALEPVAGAELQTLGDGKPTKELIRLLMALERSDKSPSLEKTQPISEIVCRNAHVNRALFWADITDQRAQERGAGGVTRFWQVHFQGARLWGLGETDLVWLEDDLQGRPDLADKQVALSGVVALLTKQSRLDAEAPRLREMVSGTIVLASELEGYLAPQRPNQALARFEKSRLENERKRNEQLQRDKQSWIDFKTQLAQNPNQLSDPKHLKRWKAGALRLYDLSRWLHHRVGNEFERAPREWRLLAEGFGQPVADAYRDGMKRIWRVVRPVRPVRTPPNSITRYKINTLAFQGVGVEAAEDPAWAAKLTFAEARRAAQHGCYSEEGYPDWIADLVHYHPRGSLPLIRDTIAYEWTTEFAGLNDFLYHYSSGESAIPLELQTILFEELSRAEPKSLDKLNTGLRILRRLTLDSHQKRKLIAQARARIKKRARNGEIEWILAYLGLLLSLDINGGMPDLIKWIGPNDAGDRQRAEQTLAVLFDRHDSLASAILEKASAATLEHLLTLSYGFIRPEDDRIHEGSYTPNTRDHAEGARNLILSTLIHRPGPDAYDAYLRATRSPAVAPGSHRLTELAHGKAERDSELAAWAETEIVSFEQTHLAPLKSGYDLLRAVIGVLNDIQLSFHKADATSKALLAHAQSEDEVQNWLAEQLNLRAGARFNSHRDAKVAHDNKPDIISASNAAPFEVAVELKHSGKGWSVRQLESALRSQLAEKYLKPENRRQGVFVLSHHETRGWLDPRTKKRIAFPALVSRLEKLAARIRQNRYGAVDVRCIGLNATARTAASSR